MGVFVIVVVDVVVKVVRVSSAPLRFFPLRSFLAASSSLEAWTTRAALPPFNKLTIYLLSSQHQCSSCHSCLSLKLSLARHIHFLHVPLVHLCRMPLLSLPPSVSQLIKPPLSSPCQPPQIAAFPSQSWFSDHDWVPPRRSSIDLMAGPKWWLGLLFTSIDT